jgi:hypothetical protein
MKQVKYQEKLAKIRQKKLLWGGLNLWVGLGLVLAGLILCFKTGLFGTHPYMSWGIFFIVAGAICAIIGYHYRSTCTKEYQQALEELDKEIQTGTR